MNRGFVVYAQNNGASDYINCALALCRSIKLAMPDESVTLMTTEPVHIQDFDHVVRLPYGDQCKGVHWKLANDWQVYWASPYEFTIKLEADMYVPRSITHWWEILANHDIIISTTIRDFKNNISHNRAYRKLFDQNKLPDVYNAITYFRKSILAQKFYDAVREIFNNWSHFKDLLINAVDEPATTDVVYAIAAIIVGIEKCTLPSFNDMSMVHMKKNIINGTGGDWTKELTWEILPHTLRIDTIPQLYPFHYHHKHFSHEIIKELDLW